MLEESTGVTPLEDLFRLGLTRLGDLNPKYTFQRGFSNFKGPGDRGRVDLASYNRVFNCDISRDIVPFFVRLTLVDLDHRNWEVVILDDDHSETNHYV
jgi:hypothetical protein